MKKDHETIKTLGQAFGLKDWAEAEAAYSIRNIKPIPKGWMTVRQYAESHDPPMLMTSSANKLKQMADLGFLDKQQWRVDGCNRNVWIYRPKKK